MMECLKKPEVVIWIVVLTIYGLSRFGLGLEYLSVWDIIKHHIDCFRNSSNDRLMIVLVIDYLVVPFMLGASATMIKIIDSEIVNIVTIIVSILTSMLFTLLAMLIDMKSKIESNPKATPHN